jgi:hypothetical protein
MSRRQQVSLINGRPCDSTRVSVIGPIIPGADPTRTGVAQTSCQLAPISVQVSSASRERSSGGSPAQRRRDDAWATLFVAGSRGDCGIDLEAGSPTFAPRMKPGHGHACYLFSRTPAQSRRLSRLAVEHRARSLSPRSPSRARSPRRAPRQTAARRWSATARQAE